MSTSYTVTLPSLGDDADAVSGATVAFWLAEVGAMLKPGDDLLEINTDKAAFVVPCPVGGVLRELLVGEEDAVHVGDALAVIEQES